MPSLSNLADQLCSGLRRQESDFGWDLIIGHVKAFRDEKGNSYICTPEEFAILLSLCRRLGEHYPGSFTVVPDASYFDPYDRVIGMHNLFEKTPGNCYEIFQDTIRTLVSNSNVGKS
jgi:hypothetical protein